MSRELFWAYKDDVAGLGGTGFSTFSLPHLLWILFCLACAVCAAAVYRRGGERRRANMRRGMALFLILFETGKQCVAVLTGAPAAPLLPLHICSVAEYAVLIDALWAQNRFFKQLMAFMFLPAAVIAILFPSVTPYPPLNFYAIHMFLLHAVIIAYIVARYAGGELHPRYAGLWLSVLATAVMAGLIYPLNAAFGTNFMFLMHHANNPALRLIWDLTGGGAAYILGLAALVILVFHIMYVVYAVPGNPRRGKRKTAE